MDSVNAFITVACGAWILQTGFGYIQMQVFNQLIQKLAQHGHMKIGRSLSRFSSRVMVVFVHGDDGIITDSYILKGRTVFARPDNFDTIIGQNVINIHTIAMSGEFDKKISEALYSAVS
ncbi:MAG: transcriptional regulator GutM [Plesiomonas sp.]|jgi:glucitol operon activator protein|uniref:transcriptional regulator GutM n=1 Tax=Gammaproteobacteria TaxID=1236 RepID=UPI001119F40A|nr:transcriptional regulator GutM [Aeromonas sobria]EKP0260920.1 transcriptional regulator GutM [Aeromonas sobria]TNH93803.1 transcriptional regulator [Aeromonas sobria]HEH9428735.1 transcriptional regulator GutM [Aeromonas sobria]HEH9433022.1 transcriptional regulator GutM [Aeromonas sobria]HEH9441037.1 transcriptional regulator GutM [Aeromonas sobria]